MIAKLETAALLGLEAHPVEVEVDLALGLPVFVIVGLPDAAIQEARQRVRAAVSNAEFDFPLRRITVNLAPADLRKEGPGFDLPIAIGILLATGQISSDSVHDYWLAGELSLSGDVRPVSGVLPLAVAAKRHGKKGIVVPAANTKEAAVVAGLQVIGVKNLCQAVGFLEGREPIEPETFSLDGLLSGGAYEVDFAEVKGQWQAKRALEIAAAGGHNVLMIGPPGAGKTMLARCLPSILPDLMLEEAIEVTKVYSVAGLLPSGKALINLRPFRAPHHTVSNAGLAGGGSHPRPGEVSLAHRGVLFLDELPEFGKSALQVLRQPLEDRAITISRARISLAYPAEFTLIAAMNPCPCGYLGDSQRACTCSPARIETYRARLGGPLLDRIDIHVEVGRLAKDELMSEAGGEASAAIKERVERARACQRQRFVRRPISVNAAMNGRDIRQFCALDSELKGFLTHAVERLGLSARAYDRVLKVARTIADLAGRDRLEAADVAEAVQYRALDRQRW